MAFNKIKEYINTGTGTEGTLLIPKLIMPTMIKEVDKALLPREMAKMVINGFPGSSYTVNLETPDSMIVREIAEGAEVPLDSISHESVTFTPKKYGVSIRITREMMEDSQFNLMTDNIATAGKRFAENENKLILTALDGANATVSGGASITIANIAEAMFNVEDNDYMPTDMIVGNEVAQDLRNIDTFVEANKAGNTDMLERGFIGTIFGMNVARFTSATSAVVSSNSKKHAYVLDRNETYGIAIKRDITVENFNLETYDMQGAAITQRIDVKLLRSKAVSKITTS